MVLRARDDDWQRVADELILQAQIILVDISEGSASLGAEAEMIEKGGRWSETVCLRHTRSLPEVAKIRLALSAVGAASLIGRAGRTRFRGWQCPL